MHIDRSLNTRTSAPRRRVGCALESALARVAGRVRGCVFCCLACFVFCAAAFAQPAAVLADSPLVNSLPVVLPAAPQPGETGFAPLTGEQRASLFFKGYLTSPTTYYESAATSGVQWIAGEPEGWARNFGGYGKREGTSTALLVMEEGIHEAGDAALGLDPRYFHCRCSGVWHRAGNAVKMTFLAYDGSGRLHLDMPRIVGDYGASMFVTTWYPAQYAPLVQGVQMGHAQLGEDVGINLLREFSPELKRFFHRLKPW